MINYRSKMYICVAYFLTWYVYKKNLLKLYLWRLLYFLCVILLYHTVKSIFNTLMIIYQLYSRKFNTIHIYCKNHRYITLQVICSSPKGRKKKKKKVRKKKKLITNNHKNYHENCIHLWRNKNKEWNPPYVPTPWYRLAGWINEYQAVLEQNWSSDYIVE